MTKKLYLYHPLRRIQVSVADREREREKKYQNKVIILIVGIYFFRQITTFIKVCVAFVFGLQTF